MEPVLNPGKCGPNLLACHMTWIFAGGWLVERTKNFFCEISGSLSGSSKRKQRLWLVLGQGQYMITVK